MFKKTSIFFFSTLILLSYNSVFAAREAFINLTLGGKKVIKLPKYVPKTFRVESHSEIALVQPDPKKRTLSFTGKTSGYSIVSIISKEGAVLIEYHIGVYKTRIDRIAHDVRKLLHGIEGVKISIIQNKVLVDGEIISPKDAVRISRVVGQFAQDVASLVSLSAVAQQKIAEIMEDAIDSPLVTVRSVNGIFLLEGSVKSESEYKKAELKAQVYLPGKYLEEGVKLDGAGSFSGKKSSGAILNLLSITDPDKDASAKKKGKKNKAIQIAAHFVEMGKTYSKHFRFQWLPSLTSQTSLNYTNRNVGGTASEITASINNLLPKLNWAKRHGFARVLNSWSLIVQDGSKGSIKSNRQISLVSNDGNHIQVEAKVALEVTPTVLDEANNILLNGVSCTIQSFLSDNETSGRTLNTSITVKSGESAALGGLLQGSSSSAFNRNPEDADQNPIVSLYSSKNFDKTDSQFIIFITPTIKSTATEGANKIRRKFKIFN